MTDKPVNQGRKEKYFIKISQEEHDQFQALAKAAREAERDAGNINDDDISPEDIDVFRAMRELDGATEVSWQIYRIIPVDKAGWVGALPTALLQVSTIAKKWGPGKYRVRGVNANGTWAKQRTIDIAEPAEGSAAAMSNAANAATGVQDLIEYMRQQNDKRAESVKSWAMVLIPVLPQLFALFKQERTGLTELVAAMQGMKTIQQPEDGMSKMKDVIAMMTMLRDAMPEGAGATGRTWVDGLVEAAKEVAPVLLAGAARNAQPAPRAMLPQQPPRQFQPAPMPGQPAPPPGPTMGAQPSPEPQQPQQDDPNMTPTMRLLLWFGNQMERLTDRARNGSNPELYAEVLADEMPRGVPLATLKTYLGRDDWWGMFANYHPPAAPFQEWFTALRNELLRMIDEAEGQAQATSFAPGESPIERDQAAAEAAGGIPNE